MYKYNAFSEEKYTDICTYRTTRFLMANIIMVVLVHLEKKKIIYFRTGKISLPGSVGDPDPN
jgi:hypothetical protein